MRAQVTRHVTWAFLLRSADRGLFVALCCAVTLNSLFAEAAPVDRVWTHGGGIAAQALTARPSSSLRGLDRQSKIKGRDRPSNPRGMTDDGMFFSHNRPLVSTLCREHPDLSVPSVNDHRSSHRI